MTFGIESDALPERERLRNTSGKSSAHVMAHRIRPREGKPYSERIAPLLSRAILLVFSQPIKRKTMNDKGKLKNFLSDTLTPRLTVLGFGILLIFLAQAPYSLAQTLPVGQPASSTPALGDTDPTAGLMNPEIQAELEKAVAAFNASQFAEALEVLQALYEKFPELVPPRIVLAQWFAQANLGTAVRANLEMGTEEVPADPEAFLLLGEISLRQGALTAAEALLIMAAERLDAYTLNPTRKENLSRSLRRVITDLHEVRQRWTQMEESIVRQIEADGRTSELLRKKGIAIFQQTRDAEAKAVLLEADRLDAESDETGLPADAVMSQLYILRGDRDAARTSLEAALTAHPNSREVLALLIQMNVHDDKLEEARELAEQLLADDPASHAFMRLRATIALYLDDFPTAERLFEALVLADPLETQNANGLALALGEQESPEKLRRALAYAIENVRRDPNNSEYLGTLGWVLFNAGQLEQAADALRQSAASGQINAATAYYLARLAIRTGQVAEARQLLNAAVQGGTPFAKRRDAVRLLESLEVLTR